MSFRIYIVPQIGEVGNRLNPPRPQYFDAGLVSVNNGDVVLTSATKSVVDYGNEPWSIVGADLPPAEDAALVSKPDAFALPIDLDGTIGAGQLANVQNKLEVANIPGSWVTAGTTWRAVIRAVLGIFSFIQRFQFIYIAANDGAFPPSLYSGGVTLDTTFGALPLAVRTALAATAASFNFDTSGFSGAGATRLRVILKGMADNFSKAQFKMDGNLI